MPEFSDRTISLIRKGSIFGFWPQSIMIAIVSAGWARGGFIGTLQGMTPRRHSIHRCSFFIH